MESPSRIGGAVLWMSRAQRHGDVRVLPDGCMDLIWDGAEVILAGPDDRAHVHRSAAGRSLTALRLAPGQGPSVTGVPARVLLNDRVPLADIWGRGRAEQLAAALTAGDRAPVLVLEDAAMDALRATPPDRLVVGVSAMAGRGWSALAMADELGLSTRQLQRRCADAFGYGPKMLVRILRLQRALSLLRTSTGRAEAAALVGYTDQSHLHRDTRDLCGVGLGELIGR